MRKALASVAITLQLFGTSNAQKAAPNLGGDLADAIAAAPADEPIPVTIVMREHASYGELLAMGETLPKSRRRAAVVAHLKGIAQRTQGDLIEFLEARGAAAIRPLWIHNLVGTEVTPSVLLEIAAREDVAYVHRDVRLPIEEVLSAQPAPPGNLTCGLQLIRAPEVWRERGINGSGVVVAVIDTGVCAVHSDIRNRLWSNPNEIPNNGIDDDQNGFIDDVRGWNFESNTNDTNDAVGHGSHVAGIVAGDGAAGIACGAAPGTRVMPLRFAVSVGSEQSVWGCMQYAVDNGADISTASLGWPPGSTPNRSTWRAVCENSIATGMVVIYSAGNLGGFSSSPDNITTPGDVPDVLTIGAVDCFDQITFFSSQGPVTWKTVAPYFDHPFPPGLTKPDVVADGANSRSHRTCVGYLGQSGTSMAAPHVAGTVALMLQADPSLDQAAVRSILARTAVDLGDPGKDNASGWGRIDALDAVDMALASGNHCAPKLNSCGTLPVIWTAGDARVGASSGFFIRAAGLSAGNLAVLVYSNQGAGSAPLLGGNLCVASISRGLPLQASGTPGQCDGQASFDMNAFAAGALGGTPAGFLSIPGTTVHAQYWGRDPRNSFGALLTGAVSYTIAP